jgi:hypothetical protein
MKNWRSAAPPGHRNPSASNAAMAGWPRHIQQADLGCDFDFLETSFGAAIGEPDIY